MKAAYRAAALKWHPDVAAESTRGHAETQFKIISQAHERLAGLSAQALARSSADARSTVFTHSGQSQARAGVRGARAASRFGNATIAAILAVPLGLTGIYWSSYLRKHEKVTGRTNGILNPPVNPFVEQAGGAGGGGRGAWAARRAEMAAARSGVRHGAAGRQRDAGGTAVTGT